MEDLGIKYIGIGKYFLVSVTVCFKVSVVSTVVSDQLLYEVGREIAGDWKVVARCLGLTAQDMADIRVKAKSTRNEQGSC
jgi:hypothetical protein